MIVFEGKMSKQCLHYFRMKEGVNCLITAAGTTLFLCVFCFYMHYSYHIPASWLWIVGIFAVVLVFYIAFFPIFTQKANKSTVPICVEINDNGTLISKSGQSSISQTIDDVVAVVDLGEFYHIIFKRKRISSSFICEKKLLVSGTITEFEKKFEGKIVLKG